MALQRPEDEPELTEIEGFLKVTVIAGLENDAVLSQVL